MTDAFTETLRSWQNFYFMAGGAAAGLTGLIFVALSLGIHLITEEMKEEIRFFVTPSIFYFVSVLLLSCLMLIPTANHLLVALLLFAGSTFGLVQTIPVARRLIWTAEKYQDFDVWDYLSQAILPVVSYIFILLSAICFAANQWSIAFSGLWLATVLLLLCAIANTWSMTIWIMEQRNGNERQSEE